MRIVALVPFLSLLLAGEIALAENNKQGEEESFETTTTTPHHREHQLDESSQKVGKLASRGVAAPSVLVVDDDRYNEVTSSSLWSLTAWGLDRYATFDIRIARQTMEDNQWGLVQVVLTYFAMVFLLPQYLAKHPFHHKQQQQHLKTIRQLWNVLLACFSLLGAAHTLPNIILQVYNHGILSSVCGGGDFETIYSGPVGWWSNVFVLSKFLELGDTLLLILVYSGKRPQFLHWFHHGTVFPLCWRACVLRSVFSQWFVALNYGVHTIMYAYFALNDTFDNDTTVRFRQAWGKRITCLQCLQFVIALGIIALAGWQRWVVVAGSCHNNATEAIVEFAIGYSIYLGLFLQFADNKYAVVSRLRHATRKCVMRLLGSGQEDQQEKDADTMPWQRKDRPITQRFEEATKIAALLLHVATRQDTGALYGYYKQAKCGDIPENDNLPEDDDEKALLKRRAWTAVRGMTKEQAEQQYVELMDRLYVRSEQQSGSSSSSSTQRQTPTSSEDPFVLANIQIAGIGKYLPRRVVTTAEVEQMGGHAPGTFQSSSRVGVKTRHWADYKGGESVIQNAVQAIRQACDRAHVNNLNEIDLIIGCYGGHQNIPDDASLVQRELGLGESGTRAFVVHATCLSFVVAMELAATMMRDGQYRCVVIFASYVSHHGLNLQDPNTAPLFGDGAAAVVLQPTGSGGSSAIHKVRMETYGAGADYCRILGGGRNNLPCDPDFNPLHEKFEMYPKPLLALVARFLGGFLDRILPGCRNGLDNLQFPECTTTVSIDWVVPHQASGKVLELYGFFNWPGDRIIRTIDHHGNCIGASIPLALCHAIETGKIQRGEKVLLIGSGAGVSLGALLFTY